MPGMVKAIRIHETGGPEVLRWEDVAIGAPGTGEVRLRHTAIGLNYIDINHRNGAYRLQSLPAVIGMEALVSSNRWERRSTHLPWAIAFPTA